MTLLNAILAVLAAAVPLQKEYISYEDFGAIGDGKHDDHAAIIAAHAEANKAGLPVRATEGRTYYIGGGSGQVVIKTDTDWGNARFIIDDVSLEDPGKQVFVVQSELKSYRLDNLKTLKKGQKKLKVILPQKSLLLVVNANKKVYIRKGLNRNKGKAQQEVLLADKDGKLYDRALPIFDYDEITKCTVFPVDERTLTIKGGIFTTIANQASEYRYYNRGILINRSNVVVDGITHYITGELDHGAPYYGFISTRDAADVTIRNCILTAHKTYSKTIRADKPVGMGTYDLTFTTTVNLHLENITQTNGINDKTYWGLTGSNFCKDVYVENCTISRFDAHQGVENVTLKNCTFGLNGGVCLVGCGTIYMENCTTYASYLIHLRPDYGSSWEGNIIAKNCILKPGRAKAPVVSILDGSNSGDHDFGYECMLPSLIEVDGLTIDDSAVKNEKYKGPCIFSTFGRDVTRSGLEPYKPTKKVILKNVIVSGGGSLRVSDNDAMFRNTKIIL